MTPLECAQGIAAYLREQIAAYGEQNETIASDTSGESTETYHVYAGFLPYVKTRAEQKALCPAIVVRPLEVNDEAEESTTLLGVYVTTYDEDKEIGSYGLYHLLEFIRLRILEGDPIAEKWRIKPGTLTTSVPDDQPYPQWWGRLDFAVYIPKPRNLPRKGIIP